MDKLLSEGAVKSLAAAKETKNKAWLEGEMDFGFVVAENEQDAQRQKEWHVQQQVKFLDSVHANEAALFLNAQSYYVTGVVGKPETLRVGDMCADHTPELAKTA